MMILRRLKSHISIAEIMRSIFLPLERVGHLLPHIDTVQVQDYGL